jgi:P4 family phage/plasmid primase-like protien
MASSPTKTNSLESEIISFLGSSRVDGITYYSHVSMVNPKGTFYFTNSRIEEFWNLYCDAVYKDKKNKINLGIAEKPQTYIPVLVDIDLKLPEEDVEDVTKKIYKKEEVISTIEIYQSILRKIINDCTEEHLICLLLEKEPYKKTIQGKTYIKNGFHLHFPYTFLRDADHSTHLIPRVEEIFKQTNLFQRFGFNKLDKGYLTAPWLLYGSKKEGGNMTSYRFTKAYNSDCEEISLEEAFSSYKIYNSKEKPISIRGKEKYYLPRLLSIIPSNREISEIFPGLQPIVMVKPKNPDGKERKTYQELELNDALEKAKSFLELISDERAEDYHDWMTIGWTLFNIGDGCNEALELWIDFSQRCQDKFNESVCIYEWEKMSKKGLTLGTLAYFAKQDSPVEYSKLTDKSSEVYIKKSLNGSHNAIAKAMFEKYGTEFVCASITHNIWYQYLDNCWRINEDGINLRTKISNEFVKMYADLGKDLYDKLKEQAVREDEDSNEKEMINLRLKQVNKIILNLESCPFKNNIMKECKEVFYNENFLKKLDKNRFIIGFKNGVYDLKKSIFRPGIPEDYISLQTSVNYNVEMTDKDQSVINVYDFLEKVFPDSNVRNYFMDVSSDVFVGGNQRKLVFFWSGENGDNAKSTMQMLFEKMLGNYSVKLPTSLITGKRTQSSAACPELVRAGNGVRWVVLQEPDKKDIINVGLLKELSGNDTFFARDLFKSGSDIEPMFKLCIICNEPPMLPYDDKAAWNRIRVIPYEATFCDNAPESYEEQLLQKRFPKDPNFHEKIPSMIEAFAWVLLNHRKSVTKIIEPDKVKLATASYRKKNDIYRQFIDESIKEGKGTSISLQELYSAFKEWFKDSMPGHTIPVKNDVKEYFLKLWGEFTSGYSWSGYSIKTLKDELDSGEAILIEDSDLVDYEQVKSVKTKNKSVSPL